MGIPERLVEIREKYGYTRKRLAEELNRPYATVTKYETGEREPGHTFIVEVAKKFGVTTDYLLGASDNPTPTISLSLSQDEAGHIKKYRSLDPYGKEAVNAILDVEHRRCTEQAQAEPEERMVQKLVYINPAAAGMPLYAESDFELMSFPENEVPSSADFGIRISGRSMEPTVADGSIVWVHKTVDIESGSVGVFMINDSAVCKRYFKDSDGTFRLESDNPKFDPAPVTEFDNVVPVGKVVGTT